MFKNLNIENYKNNTLFVYTIANFIKEKFREVIEEIDLDNTVIKKRTEIIINPDVFEKEPLKSKIEKLEAAKKEWSNAHPSYYRQQPSLPSRKDYKNFLVINPKDYSLEEAIQIYKAANDILKGIDNSSLDEFCTETKSMLNYEHKSEYDEFINSEKEKLGIPSNEELLEMFPLEVSKSRICLDRQPCEDLNIVTPIIGKFLENLNCK